MDVWEIHGSRERSIPPRLVRALYDDAGWWPARTEADIAAVLAANSAVGAWVGADLVGFARLVTDGRLRAFIEDVVVHHAYRRRGIATAMLQHLLNEAGQLEVVSLFCEPGLVPLYQHLGFRPTSQVVLHRARRVGRSCSDGR